jgi:hypothetical protein
MVKEAACWRARLDPARAAFCEVGKAVQASLDRQIPPQELRPQVRGTRLVDL